MSELRVMGLDGEGGIRGVSSNDAAGYDGEREVRYV